MRLKVFLFCTIFSVSLLSGPAAYAVEDGTPIRDIIVEGAQNISPELVLSQVRLKKGAPFDGRILNEDLRRLYSLGYFSDISVETEEVPGGVDIIFFVSEKLTVRSIHFKGNKELRTKKLTREITILEGSVLNQSIIQDDVNKLVTLYESKGHHMVKVKAEINADPDDQSAAVTFVIDEGARVKIRSIEIEGNIAFKDNVLIKQLRTKTKGIFRSGYLRQDMFQADLDLIIYYYRDHGYLNASIVDVKKEYTPNKSLMDITIFVHEGLPYRVGLVNVSGNALFPTQEISSIITLETGGIYSVVQAGECVTNIEEFYSNRGYIYADVSLLTNVDDEVGIVNAEFRIKENEKTYVENIIIRGNKTTKDIVIRRNIAIKPLDVFDGTKIKASQDKLLRMEYFEDVKFDIEPGSMKDHENLIVDVIEKKTGNLSFGAGYSTIENLIGFIELTQSNFDIGNFPTFIGGGQSLRIRTEIGRNRRDFEINFVEPWLFDYPVLFGLDLFNKEFFRDDFDERRTGAAVRLGKALGDYNYISGRYKIENVEIGDFSIDSSPIILAEGGSTLLSSLTVALSRNTTDSRDFPTHGYETSFSTEFMGGPVGGDVDFVKYFLSGKQYFSVNRRHVLELSANMGTIQRYKASDRVPIFERFFAGGGNSIRGFGFREVTPRDAVGNPIGGRSIFLASAEYSFPLYQNVIRGAVFYDTGNVYEDEFTWNIGDLAAGAGLGVRVKTPFGPMKLDYAWVIDEDERDPFADNARWHFGVGKLF